MGHRKLKNLSHPKVEAKKAIDASGKNGYETCHFTPWNNYTVWKSGMLRGDTKMRRNFSQIVIISRIFTAWLLACKKMAWIKFCGSFQFNLVLTASTKVLKRNFPKKINTDLKKTSYFVTSRLIVFLLFGHDLIFYVGTMLQVASILRNSSNCLQKIYKSTDFREIDATLSIQCVGSRRATIAKETI